MVVHMVVEFLLGTQIKPSSASRAVWAMKTSVQPVEQASDEATDHYPDIFPPFPPVTFLGQEGDPQSTYRVGQWHQ